MLDIDYKFIRNQGNKIENFTPDPLLKDISSNIIVLEAPNASGKSTLLNILAIGLFGNRLDKSKCHISESLLERMNDLLNSSNHELTFSFTINSPNDNKKVISSKVNPKTKDIEVYEIENEKRTILTDITFPKKYYLIYDIPENPLQRLPHLIQQMKAQQTNIGFRVTGLKNAIHEILTEIKDSKDPQKIANLTQQIQNLNDEIKRKQIEVADEKTIAEKLIFYQALKFSRHYLRVKENLEFEIGSLMSKISNIDRNKKTKNTQFDNQKQNAIDIFENITRNRSELLLIIDNVVQPKKNKKVAENLRYFEKYDPYQMMTNFKVDEKFLTLIDLLKDEIESKKSEKDLIEISEKTKFYSEILNLLKIYENQNFSIPGINKSLHQLIDDIEKEKIRNSKFVKVIENYERAISLIGTIKNEFDKLPDILTKLETLSTKIKEYKDTNGDFDSLNHRLESRQREHDTVIAKIAIYSQILSPKIDLNSVTIEEIEGVQSDFEHENKKLNTFFLFTEDQLTNEINKINGQVTTISQKISRDEQIRDKYQEDLAGQEKKKPHRYQDYYTELDSLHSKCEKLERTIRQLFGTYLNDLELKKQPKNDEEKRFYDVISVFLSRKIPEVPYNLEMIKTSKIDLINQLIIDETGERRIKFSDISTGQGISLYLRSLLNLPKEDPRKIIAFFDEIATMDTKSLNFIINDLKTLNNNNRLLCAILVQKSDIFRIRNIDGD